MPCHAMPIRTRGVGFVQPGKRLLVASAGGDIDNKSAVAHAYCPRQTVSNVNPEVVLVSFSKRKHVMSTPSSSLLVDSLPPRSWFGPRRPLQRLPRRARVRFYVNWRAESPRF